MKSRFVALALICIILSSSSISTVDGFTISFSIRDVNEKFVVQKQNVYNVMLFDGSTAHLINKNDHIKNHYEILIHDATGIKLNDINKPVDQDYIDQNIISVKLEDGINADTNKDKKDDQRIKIIKIKQNDERKALWERIFPLDRIINNKKTLYKEIQTDHSLSYVQLSEINSENQETEQLLGSDYDLQHEIEKFFGKANYVGIQLETHWKHLADVEKFFDKANYLGDQLGIRAQQLADPEKFVKKSKFVGDQLTISVYRVVDPNQPTLLVLLIPLVGLVLIRSEHERLEFYHVQRFVCFVFIAILVSSAVISPFYLSSFYWGNAFAQEPEELGPPDIIPDDNQKDEPVIEEPSVPPPIEEIIPEPEVIPEEPVEIIPEEPVEIIPEEPVEIIPEEPVEIIPEKELPVELPIEAVPEEIIPEPVELPVEPTVNQTDPIETIGEPIVNKIDPIETIKEPTVNQTEPIILSQNYTEIYDEPFVFQDNVSFNLTKHVTELFPQNYTILFNETLSLTTDLYSIQDSILPQNKTILLDEQFGLTDRIILPFNNYQINLIENITISEQYTTDYNETIPIIIDRYSNLNGTLSFFDNISFNFTDGNIPPNATEEWNFENKTDGVTLNDDAVIDDTEGINGTSLLLDGDLDFAQTNATNSTTYINDMSIAAWVKPNYTKGSPEFTVVSKGKSFVLSINNIIEPEHVAKFSIFDGIKWTALESTSTIPDSSWTHLTARFNKTAIELYVNGTLENSLPHNGIPYVSERGQIELKTLQEITSFYDILIGASLTPNMESDAYNMFSGMIDGVALYDYRLGPEDVQKIYKETTPIKTILPEPEPRGIPDPALFYRILKTEDLPVSVNIDELNTEIDELTVSAWVTPNYTGGSTEFTVLSRESSFALAINKMVSPEQMAKFSVYDGITWSTVTGSTPINGTAFVTAVFNKTNVSLYVNGTLDGRLDSGPSSLVSSALNVTIGAYENTLRSEAKQSNFFAGTLEDVTVYQYAMVDKEVLEKYQEYQAVDPPTNERKLAVTLLDSVGTLEENSLPSESGIPIVLPGSFVITDDVLITLNGIPQASQEESLEFSEKISFTLNNQTIIPQNNKTVTVSESLSFLDSVLTTVNQTEIIPVNTTALDEPLIVTDSIFLKLNDTTFSPLEEGLQFTEDTLFFLNGEPVILEISNQTSDLIHSTIEIGKIVNWTQTVMLNDTEDVSNILVELPADAQNIEIEIVNENGTATEIPQEELIIIESELEETDNEYDVPKMGKIKFNEIAREHNITKLVPLDYAKMDKLKEIKQENKPTKAILVNETRINANVIEQINSSQNNTTQNQTEYIVKFQTPAPYTQESNYSTETKFQRNVTVTHNSTLHYTDVRSYSDIPEYLAMHGVEFNLHWVINGSKVDVTNDPRFDITFVDTDVNGVVDRMEWTVPQLSEQEFEIEADIQIINVQSYPIVNGNWTVNFNTTGTADLVIRGIAGTTFGNSLPDDLKFLELNNGTHTLTPTINLTENTITYHNYTSNYTGFETSQVLTPGKHHLEFRFGSDVSYAHNLAVYEVPHAFAFQNNAQTTTSPTYSDISGAVLSSSNFVAGNKYLIYVTGLMTGDQASSDDALYIRAAHGSTAFSESEQVLVLDDTTGDYYNYNWFTVWTATSGEDITLQFRTDNTGVTMTADQLTLFAMEISELFDEGQDWFYDVRPPGAQSLSSTWTSTNNALITIPTSVEPNNEWLVIGTAHMGDFDLNSRTYNTRIQATGDVNDNSIEWLQENEEATGTEQFVQTLMRTYSLPATVTQTFEVENSRQGTGSDTNARKSSAIFAINLDKFDSHSASFNGATQGGIETDNELLVDATNVATTSFTPTTAGDVWVLGQFVEDMNTGDVHMLARLQVNQVDAPLGWTNQTPDLEVLANFDSDEEKAWSAQNVTTHDRSLLTVDVDVSKEGTGGSEQVEDRFAMAVSLFQKPVEGAQGSAIIKRVLSGSETMTGTTLNVNIAAVDLEKSFLVFSYSTDDPDPSDFLIAGELTTSTNVQFERAAAGSTAYIEWYVAEFESGVYVQRGVDTHASANVTVNLPVSVDDSSSFVLGSVQNTGSIWSNDDHLRMRLCTDCFTASADLELYASAAVNYAPDAVKWQVVEYAGAQVQRDKVTMTAAQTTQDVGINTVNLNKTFVLSTYYSAASVFPRNGGLETDLDADNNVHFERDTASGVLEIAFEAVEFTGGEHVQSGTLNFGNTELKKEIIIDPVDLTKSIAFLSHHQKGGQGSDNGGSTASDDLPGAVWFLANLTSSNTLNITRTTTISDNSVADVTWHVIQFSDQADAAFTNVTTAAGLGGAPSLGGAIVFGDYDNDGWMDFYMNNDQSGDTEQILRLNNQNNTFQDADANIDNVAQGRGAGAGDFDNDGDLDIIAGHNVLLLDNDGNAVFTDTDLDGANTMNPEAMMFVDIDKDADLDIWGAGQDRKWVDNTNPGWSLTVDVPGTTGPTTNGEGASATDLDADGDLDLIYSESATLSDVALNDGDGTYTRDADPNTGAPITGLPNNVGDHENLEWAWADYDNDGDMDVYISGVDNEGLYENDGTGAFTDVTTTSGITTVDPDGAAWGDYDNDGDLDLVLSQDGGVSNLWRNEGDKTFSDQAVVAGFAGSGDLGKTVGFFDSDNDGDLDLLVNRPVTFWRNNLYDHETPSSNANEYFKVVATGNATNAGGKIGSPRTPIGAQINITTTADVFLAHREITPSTNQLAPPHMQHFGGVDPNTEYNIVVKFPSGTVTTYTSCIPGNIKTELQATYGSYMVPQSLNVTETSGDDSVPCSAIPVDVNDDLSEIQDEIISAKLLRTALIQPDAGAPGMKLAINILGTSFNEIDIITTTSTDIVVGPVNATDEAGNYAATGASVLSTTFFINNTALDQTVDVLVNGKTLLRDFKIVIPTTDSGDFTGQTGPFTLGDGNGRNGNRTAGGTIVLDKLIIPAGETAVIDIQDRDSISTHSGYLPAIIIVDGDIDIQGTLDISGTSSTDQHGGHGAPGGGGGGGGGATEADDSPTGDTAGRGGDGFAGGGGSGNNIDMLDNSGKGGDGSGKPGESPNSNVGGNGGTGILRTGTNGTKGEVSTLSNGNGGGGGGGSGFVFGSGGGAHGDGAGNGGGEGSSSDANNGAGGGAGFGTAGSAGGGGGTGGAGGLVTANSHLIPLSGGSGGGGGAADSNSGAPDRRGGGGGGGGGSVLLYGIESISISGAGIVDVDGGDGGPDTIRGGGGGAGSGGAIVLQSQSVDSSAGTLSALGGTGGTGTTADGGDGGDGRVRVDGLRVGTTTIEGLGAFGGSEYVGPAITQVNSTHITGRADVLTDVEAMIWNGTAFNNFTATSDANGNYAISVTYSIGENFITVIQNNSPSIFVMSSAATWLMFVRDPSETISAEDTLYAKSKIFIEDNTGIQDEITIKVFVRLTDGTRVDSLTITDAVDAFTSVNSFKDSIGINDQIFPKFKRTVNDETAVIDDHITIRVFYLLQDEIVIDDIVTLPTEIDVGSDEAGINDQIFAKAKIVISDETATVDDSLVSTIVIFKRSLQDDVTIDDFISLSAEIKIFEEAGVSTNDQIFAKSKIALFDEIVIDEFIGKTTKVELFDEILIDDVIFAKRTIVLQDNVLVSDELFNKIKIPLFDEIIIDEFIGKTTKVELFDEVIIADFISAKTFALINETVAGIALTDDIFATTKRNLFDEITIEEFVGKKSKADLFDETVTSDQIFALTRKLLQDNIVLEDQLLAKSKISLFDEMTLQDVLGKKTKINLQDEVIINDVIFTKSFRELLDEVVIDDVLFAKARITLFDEVLILDILGKKIKLELLDEVVIEDVIFTKIFRFLSDEILVDANLLFKRIKISSLQDGITIQDFLGKVSKVILVDEVITNEAIIATTRKFLIDSILAEDLLLSKTKIPLFDEMILQDVLGKKTKINLRDEVTINGKISALTRKLLEDTIHVEDLLLSTSKISLFDEVITRDVLGKKTKINLRDEVGIDDVIFAKVIRFVTDEIGISDQIFAKTKISLFDEVITRDVLGKVIKLDLFDEVGIDDVIFAKVILFVTDEIGISDQIFSKTKISLFDEVGIDDVLGKKIQLDLLDAVATNDTIYAKAKMTLFDEIVIDTSFLVLVHVSSLFTEVGIDDVIFTKVFRAVPDNVGVSDVIFAKAKMNLFDEVTTNDAIFKKASLSLFDEVGIEDVLGKKIQLDLLDAVATNDTIYAKAKMTLFDEIVIDTSFLVLVHVKSLFTEVGIDDVIFTKIFRAVPDNVGVSDVIFAKAKMNLFDEVTTNDAIFKKASLSLFDEVGIEDVLGKKIQLDLLDAVATNDTIYAKAKMTLFDEIVIDTSFLVLVHVKSLFTEVGIDDVIFTKIFRAVPDNVGVSDVIFAKAKMTLFDEVTTNDAIFKKASLSLFDEVGIDDVIFTKVFRLIPDNVGVSDVIFAKAKMTLFDEVTTNDAIFKKASLSLFDEIGVDDAVFTKIGKKLFDTMSTDDQLSAKAKMRIFDEVGIVSDIVKFTRLKSIDDSMGIDDVIFTKVFRLIPDNVGVSDVIFAKAKMTLFDEVTTNDAIFKKASLSLFDEIGVDDAVFTKIGKKLFDTMSTDDQLSAKAKMRIFDEVGITSDIVKFTRLKSIDDSMGIDDFITTKIKKNIFDAVSTNDIMSFTARMRVFDTISVDDAIFKKASLSLFDEIGVDDAVFTKIGKKLFDTMSTDDQLSAKAKMRIFDEVGITSDIVKFTRLKSIDDSMGIDDFITTKIKKNIFDAVSTNDMMSFTARMRVFDTISVDDAIFKKASISLFDEVGIQESVNAKAGMKMFDSASTDDMISFKAKIALVDGTRLESTTTFDTVSIKPSLVITDISTVDDTITTSITYRRMMEDVVSVDDTIFARASLVISDGINSDDVISLKAKMTTFDEIGVDDGITTSIAYGRIMQDNVGIDGTQGISILYRGTIFDGATIDDSITIAGSLFIEVRDEENDFAGIVSSYLIIPDPATGTGSLTVVDNGAIDINPEFGAISIYPVPLGTYRINQTAPALPYLPLINFTYATVHPQDINATALFRSVIDPAELPVLELSSDIIDIRDYEFDDLLSTVQLVKINNETEIIINKTTDMPTPVFAGIANATALNSASDLQFALIYKNLAGLVPNDTPQNIISAFRQTEYDAGNFTETAFVGVLSATEESTFGQYLATQPFDRFSCGMQYIYGLNNAYVPSYGGITHFNFTLSSTGTCPDTQDYLTHEIASTPPAGSGTPLLSGEDILLYINPQNPAAGVDFSNPANINSFNYTLISPLPATGDIDDLTVYLLSGASWTTNGVTELSKQLITSGPNAGLVEIKVSLTHLNKIVVGGERIPIPPPPTIPPGGFGRVLVGPSSGPSGGAPESVAKIHRIEYDVCNENISRILVGHASDSPPLIQLLATKSGVIDATLAAHQPYLVQNEFTLVDRYLFEAPLAPGENIFTIFAVDYRSNVDRVLVEVEGCEGVIIFVDDQIVLPNIFDVKYQLDNSTYKPDIKYSYVDEGQEIEVSSIVQSPIVPLLKAELYVSTLGVAEQTILPMDIVTLELPELDDLYIISSTIPEDLIQGPAVEYWVRVVTEEGIVQESEHSIVGVKPEGYDGTSTAEMDTVTIKAQGTSLKPTAYLTNEGEVPVYGTVSLLVDGETVYSKPTILTPGQNRINLEWSIPKSDTSVNYAIQTVLEVYDKQYITSTATLNTFVRTQIVPIGQQSEIISILDANGNTIARPAMMYSSNEGAGQFRVTAPDGTCVIGAGCIVEQSTLLHRGGIDSVILDGQIYRVRYSGVDSPLERFSITSLDSVLGQWTVEIELIESVVPLAAATEDNSIKVQYRAERSPLVTVRSE